jgi:excisionase family DNA binding protein
MNYSEDIRKPSKEEQKIALESYNALEATLKTLNKRTPTIEIEIDETNERIKVPLAAMKLLAKILEATSKGNPISVLPIATELTTQSAAELLGCSRPHLVKLVESGAIPFIKVGRHRRLKYEDVIKYKKRLKETQRRLMIEMMKADEETGMYDS